MDGTPAVCVDADTRTREEATFFGTSHDLLFGVLHLPHGTPSAGVVVVSPLHMELVRNYRREVLLARTLAAHGIAVQRFHYRGTGHSDGDSTALSCDSMLDDLADAVAHLRSRTGVERLALVGTRLGALVASVGNAGGDPIALWEPVVDATRYYREVGRFGLMRAAAGRGTPPPSTSAELEQRGMVNVLGYELTADLLETSRAHPIEAAPLPRAAFIAQTRRLSARDDDSHDLARIWAARGVDVETLDLASRGAWWFAEDVLAGDWSHKHARERIDATRDWILKHA